MSIARNAFAALLAALLVGAGARSAAAADACRMELIAEFKVKDHGSPAFEAKINGRVVHGVLDTGAFSSVITARTANALGLHQVEIPGLEVAGIGGRRKAFETTLDTLEFGGGTFHHFRIVVVDALRRSNLDMLIGRDFLTRTDLEFDLAHGSVRMLRPQNCKSDQMVYWTDKPYSQAPLQRASDVAAYDLKVKLNAAVVDAVFDSGAFRSVASLDAAERAHVALGPPVGAMSGLGEGAVDRRVGVLGSVTIGDETVRNTRLEFADIFRGAGAAALGTRIQTAMDGSPDMLLGADFLASHRVLVSPSQKMIYFTYVGGPPFDTGPTPSPNAPPPPARG